MELIDNLNPKQSSLSTFTQKEIDYEIAKMEVAIIDRILKEAQEAFNKTLDPDCFDLQYGPVHCMTIEKIFMRMFDHIERVKKNYNQ